MIDGSHINLADGYAEGRVLDSLEFLDQVQGWWNIRETDGSGIHGKGFDKGFVGIEDILFLLTWDGTSITSWPRINILRMLIRY